MWDFKFNTTLMNTIKDVKKVALLLLTLRAKNKRMNS